MNKKIKNLALLVIGLLLIIKLQYFAYAVETFTESKEKYLTEESEILKNLKERLKKSLSEFSSTQNSSSHLEFALGESEKRVATLTEQISNIDSQIITSEEKIVNIALQIEKKELEINKLSEELEIKRLQLEEHEDLLSEYLRFLFYQESLHFDYSTQKYNPLKLIFDSSSVSQTIDGIYSLHLFEAQVAQIMARLSDVAEGYLVQSENLKIQKKLLSNLRNIFSDHRANLTAMKDAKSRLLDETKGRQDVYERLMLAEVQMESQIAREISLLSLNVSAFEAGLEKLRDAGTPEDIENAIKLKESILKRSPDTISLLDDKSALAWPLSPYRGITAYFSDSGYAARFGANHNAIDIRAPHGTAIFAPADSIVLKTVGADSDDIGYHYVVLAHGGGLNTVYGHASRILVSEGQFIKKGEIIALTGGIPGTTGAGLRTTGPHLHFEVHRDGKKADPLEFLTLGALPVNFVPSNMLERYYEEFEEYELDES